MVSQRFSKANNPYIKGYNRSKHTSYIQYFDTNNLYGWAVSQPLPIGKFQWLTNDEINSLNIKSIQPDSKKGYILEVDLEYPIELHNSHDVFPLAPLIIPKEWMSDYQLELLKDRPAPRVHKLTPNLHNKIKYVLHYRNLQLYLQLGMKFTKIHRILKFDQELFMRSYIDLNTHLRKNAKSDFEKLIAKTIFRFGGRLNLQFYFQPPIGGRLNTLSVF